MSEVCHICLSDDIFYEKDEPLICDRCGEYYCFDCSYTFTLHYQHEGMRCYWCSNQNRGVPLDKRDKKLDYILRK